jgi:predicted nucleic acid-binding protein
VKEVYLPLRGERKVTNNEKHFDRINKLEIENWKK